MEEYIFDMKADDSFKRGEKILNKLLEKDDGESLKEVFKEHLISNIDQSTFLNLGETLRNRYDVHLVNVLLLPLREKEPHSIDKYKKLGFSEKETDFLLDLWSIFSSKVRTAWNMYKFPDQWTYAKSEFYSDGVVDVGLSTSLLLGDGSSIQFKSNIVSCFDLVNHIFRYLDMFVEDGTIEREKLDTTERYLQSLRKKLVKEKKSKKQEKKP